MTPLQTAIYGAAGLLTGALTITNISAYRRLRPRAGNPQVRWSRLFHAGFAENILVLGLASAVAVWSLALIALQPGSPGGYRKLLLLAFGLSFAPSQNAVIGSRGIVFRLRYIPWPSVKSMSYASKKTRVLLRLVYETSPGSGRVESMIIPLPRNIDLGGQPGPDGCLEQKRGKTHRCSGQKGGSHGGEGGIRTHGPSIH